MGALNSINFPILRLVHIYFKLRMILLSILGVICPQFVRFSCADVSALVFDGFEAVVESGDLDLIRSRNLRCIHWSFNAAGITVVNKLRRRPHLQLLGQKTILVYVVEVFYFVFVP